MLSVWYWLSLERKRYWSSSLRTSSSQCHSWLILFPHHKPLDPMMDIYDSQNFDLKTRLDIWMSMYVNSRLRGRDIVVRVWGQGPGSVTVNWFWFLTINHLILWWISMTVRLLTWNQGWIYGWGCIWFQYNKVLLVCYWDYLKVEFYVTVDCWSISMDWSLDLIEEFVFLSYIEFLQTL